MNLININLFSGPGVGKSTTAAGLFHKMKTNNMKVEYVQEYAKDLTYGKDFVKLSDQLLLLGKQHHRMFRLKDQVDYAIHDSSFIIGMVYADEKLIPLEEFENLLIALYHRYEHINILLKRNKDIEYQEYGRNQSLDQAIQKDEEIKDWLVQKGIPFYEVEAGPNCVNEIFEIIKKE